MLTILALLLTSVAATPQVHSSVDDARWKVVVATDQGPLQDTNIGPDCHTLAYFSNPGNLNQLTYLISMTGSKGGEVAYETSVTQRRVGEISGFPIYEVILHVNQKLSSEVRPYRAIKLILVERTRGKFCQILNEPGQAENVDADGPAVIVGTASGPVLAAGQNVREYWAFDENGPVYLDLYSTIFETVRGLLPPGRFVPTMPSFYAGFDIAALTFSVPVLLRGNQACCPTGGAVTLKLKLENHRLIVTDRKFDPSPPN
jgi:hypothetical protein